MLKGVLKVHCTSSLAAFSGSPYNVSHEALLGAATKRKAKRLRYNLPLEHLKLTCSLPTVESPVLGHNG